MFIRRKFMTALKRFYSIMLFTFLQPRSPSNAPTAVPSKAPTMGIGINVCPTTAPNTEEPTVAPVFIKKPVTSASFLLSVLKWFVKIL